MYYVDRLNKTSTNAKMSSFKLMHLILKTRNPNKIIENILNFFDLKANDLLLNEFNFIRFASSPIIPTSVQTQLKRVQTNPVKAPAYSILLFTSNYANDESSRLGKGWRYHHKLELKDEKQHVIARQTFYEQSLDLPLFCMSNIRQDIMVEHTKRIIRLNINCRNFDSMLIFYRLLFDKYSNYSKRNFSVFILYQAKSFELQLSLKYDESIEPYKLDGVSLMHFIESSNEFNTILHLLNGLTNELIPGRLYSVSDPDGNQIYLVDHSKGPLTSNICMAKGLADLVFDELYESKSEDPSFNTISNNSTFSTSSTDFTGANSARTKVSNLSCATDTSSTNSESISLDSGRGSDHWSLFSDNQMQKRLNRKKASSIGNLNVQDKSNDNQYYDFCYGKISAAKSLAQRKKNKQLQSREIFNLQNIERHLNTSSDEFEGLLSLKPSDYLRKAKSVSFVDKVGDHFENLSNSAVNLSCCNQNQTRSSAKSSLKSISHKPYEWLSDTRSVVRKDSARYAQQENVDLNYLSKNFCANRNSSKSSIQISKNENLFRKCSPVNPLRVNIEKRPSLRVVSKKPSQFNSNGHLNDFKNSIFSDRYVHSGYISSIALMKPFIGITPQTRLRKAHALNMIRSTHMPLDYSHDVLIAKDNYDNDIFIPVAKF